MNKWFLIALFALSSWFSLPGTLQACTLSELAEAVQSHYKDGDISDANVKVMLDDLLTKAWAAANTDEETTYRNSIIEVVNTFAGTGITSSAAAHLQSMAEPYEDEGQRTK